VHEQELNVLGVADKERLVAGRSEESGLLVGAETDLGEAMLTNPLILRTATYAED
jgi:hypothetical protein